MIIDNHFHRIISNFGYRLRALLSIHLGCLRVIAHSGKKNGNTLPRVGIALGLRPRSISRASGCKLPQGAYFPIHPSSRQCIITILSWGKRCMGNYTSNGWVVSNVLNSILPLCKKNVKGTTDPRVESFCQTNILKLSTLNPISPLPPSRICV